MHLHWLIQVNFSSFELPMNIPSHKEVQASTDGNQAESIHSVLRVILNRIIKKKGEQRAEELITGGLQTGPQLDPIRDDVEVFYELNKHHNDLRERE